MTKNAMNLHNVHKLKNDDEDRTTKSYSVDPIIADVIWELASKYPLWQFHATNGIHHYNRTEFVHTAFEVKLNGKNLGNINKCYNRRSDSAIEVKCKRIADKLERKSSYTTEDPKKAIAKVRKEFAPKTYKETIDEAMQEAKKGMYHAYSDFGAHMRRAVGTFQNGIMEFYTAGPGLEIYKSHLNASRPDDAKILAAMQAKEEASVHMMTISSVRDKIGKEGTALVVVDEGKYLVKILDDLQMYSDTTLPENLKGKLGLLKLIQPNQFVSSAGFRVSDEVFVIDLTA